MAAYVALVRAVNVGGTGKLAMSELTAMCAAAGFQNIQTYIASGNVVFRAKDTEAMVKAALETRLRAFAGRPVAVIVRTAQDMADVLARNPFPDAAPNRTVAIFLDRPPPRDTLGALRGQTDEKVRLGKREIYVAYGADMAGSKLKIPAGANGTARNINTIARLAERAGRLPT